MKIFTKLFLLALLLLGTEMVKAQSNVTFKVDMTQYTGLNDTVYVNGTWNNWCGRCNPLVKQGNTNIWEGTYPVPNGAAEFKYTIGGWNAQENLTSGSPCTITTGSFTNRSINVTGNLVLPVVCWQSCTACVANNQVAMDLPVNFDSTNVNYVLTDFGGNSSVIGNDPTDSTNKVAITTKSNVAELWAGTTIGGANGFPTAIPFAQNATKMSIRVYSPNSGIPVRLKVEDATDGSKSCETEVMTTTANAWETLEFNFANPVANTQALNLNNTYKKVSVFFNFGTTGAVAGTKVYYFDDVKFIPGTGPILNPIKLPIDFQATNVDYTVTDFGGNASTMIDEPGNASNKVMSTVKSNTAELWAGTTMSTPAGLAEVLPFSAGKAKVKVKVFSPDSGIVVRLKAEVPGDPTKSVETDTRTTMANAWEEMIFNFENHVSGTAAINYAYSYKMLSIFFNFGVTGANAGTKTYMWDNVMMLGDSTPPPPPPAKVNIAFTVDARALTLAPTDTLTLNGTFNGWCGECIKMRNIPGTKIWTVNVPLDTMKEIEYKFTVGNWSKQETLNPNFTCTKTTGSFTNRVFVTGKTNDSIPMVCWESCTTCPTVIMPKTKVSFKVNMKDYTGDMSKGITLNGTFNGWCGECTPMTNMGGTIYGVTLDLDTGVYDFKFTIGNWVAQEEFTPGAPCTRTKDGFTNRTFYVADTNAMLIGTYCYNSCNKCDANSLSEEVLNNLRVYPNPANDVLHLDFGMANKLDSKITVYNTIGEELIGESRSKQNTGVMNIDIKSLKQGIYLLKIEMENSVKMVKFQVN